MSMDFIKFQRVTWNLEGEHFNKHGFTAHKDFIIKRNYTIQFNLNEELYLYEKDLVENLPLNKDIK